MTTSHQNSKHLLSLKRIAIISVASLWLATCAWHTNKPMPPGTNIESPTVAVPMQQVQFLLHLTAVTADGQIVITQQIFDAVFAAIDLAQHFVVLDYFLL